MYNRSPRFGIKYPTSTPPEVCPYTYMLDDPLQVKRVNVVPFCSTEERKPLSFQYYTDAIYNAAIKENVVGGHSMRNKAERFTYAKISDIPPPGRYDPKLPGMGKRTSNEPPPGKGRLYLCNVPYSFVCSAPSIPTHIDANGYDIGYLGRLIKNKAQPRGKSVGPNTYYINVNSCGNSDPCSGCHWSKRSSKRDYFTTDDGPGPGDYDVEKTSTCRRDEAEEDYREMARRFAHLPRHTEQHQCLAMRQNYPSPNQYKLPSIFEFKPPVTTIVKPFISRTPRFGKSTKQLGTIYDIATPRDNPAISMKGIPFSISAKRFKTKEVCIDDPQPGLYLPKGFGDIIVEKNLKPHALFRPPFNSTVRREFNLVSDDAKYLPDETASFSSKPALVYRVEHGHSVFISTTERSRMIELTSAPPVSKYSVTESFNRNRNKRSHNKKKLPFQSTANRETFVLLHKDNPGPSGYLGQQGLGQKGYFFDRSDRFKDNDRSDAPPPDYYYIHPLYQDSVYRAKNTFNLNIAESVFKKKLRLPPKDTYKEYMKLLKKKKKLRCYSTYLDE